MVRSGGVQRRLAIVSTIEDTHMLARRFTIVCLIVSIFGMLLAMAVTEANRKSRAINGWASFCGTENGNGCAPLSRR